jgi:flavin reductase (DIM6/NTAB) family NADH-FMN oxidoreductase RutF
MNVLHPVGEIDPAEFRRVMGRFASGVTVITAEVHGETRGMTANAFMSGSLAPPLCIVSVAKRAHMHGHLREAGRFAVNILAAGQGDHATHFAGRPNPGIDVAITRVGGIPTLGESCAWMTAEIAATHDCGDHTIFIGHIQKMAANDRPPLLYHAGRYAGLVPIGEPNPAMPEFW